MNTPELVMLVEVVCLQSMHPPDFTHLIVVVWPSGEVVLFALQSGLFGSPLVHSQVMVAVAPAPPPPARAVTITPDVTSRSPGSSCKRNCFLTGRDVRDLFHLLSSSGRTGDVGTRYRTLNLPRGDGLVIEPLPSGAALFIAAVVLFWRQRRRLR
jgi:hypothetical protein